MVKGEEMTDAQRFYIIAMIMIIVKKRQGKTTPFGVIRVLRAMKNLQQ